MKEGKFSETQGEKTRVIPLIWAAAGVWSLQGVEETERESEREKHPDKRVNHNKYL